MDRVKGVVLLPSVEEQMRAGDKDIIDPLGVRVLPDDRSVILFNGGGYDFRSVVGIVHDIRVESGRLVGDVELSEENARLDWGGVMKRHSVHVAGMPKDTRSVLIQTMDLLECHLGGKRPTG